MEHLVVLIALTLIAAGAIAADSAEVPIGEKFEAPGDVATALINSGQAQLFVEVPQGKPVKARVLMACPHGQPDDVVTLSPDVAQAAQAAGQVDTHKSAVAYAERQIADVRRRAKEAATQA